MSLQSYMTCLSTEHLMLLHSDLVTASLANDLKGNHKLIFIERKKESTGKRKKIYAALAKANKKEVGAMADAIVSLIENKHIVYYANSV